jgi:hypothetical protein
VASSALACGAEELRLESRIDERATLQLAAPRAGLVGPCDVPFAIRFCRAQFEPVGSVVIRGGDRRTLALEDELDRTCGNILWVRLVRLDDVGPVADEGALFELPASAEIEYGAGALHAVAFPQGTVRLDEVGDADARQARPPRPCPEDDT